MTVKLTITINSAETQELFCQLAALPDGADTDQVCEVCEESLGATMGACIQVSPDPDMAVDGPLYHPACWSRGLADMTYSVEEV